VSWQPLYGKLTTGDTEVHTGAVFGSYGWGREAPVMIADKMCEIGVKVIDPVLRIQYQLTEKDIEECKRLGKDIANDVKRLTAC
jgi:flavorubredoxin